MKYLIPFLFMSFPATLLSQNNEILTIVQDQVDAFNLRDVDRLVNNITDDFKWYYIGADTLFLELSGREEFRTSMEQYFSQIKTVQSEIADYTIDGNRISFKEIVTYETTSGKKSNARAMAIYEVKDGLIYRVWYFL